MENNLRNEIEAILEEIEEAYWEEDYDEIVQRYMDIPADCWKDAVCFSRIIETVLFTDADGMTVDPIDVIPDWFWEDKSMVQRYYLNDLQDFYAEDRIRSNLCELLPMQLLDDPECARLLLECNVDETLSYIDEKLIVVPEIALAAVHGVRNKVDWSEYNCSSMRPPLDERECLEKLLEALPKGLAADKAFVLDFIINDCFPNDPDLFYEWMDEALWSDQDIVWEILSNDRGALEYVSQDLLQNADFAKKLEDELDLSI